MYSVENIESTNENKLAVKTFCTICESSDNYAPTLKKRGVYCFTLVFVCLFVYLFVTNFCHISLSNY